ncbi:hypothetical protein [Nitrosospira sp. NpAV]|uniref:hypothetical protein n=1 Tax=Nitrosospira sp. NpAV TaxID=58133 RepID=UPI0005A07B17|nr:hypothetical protein [Nitrosospira sp. NpAV]KIO49618.1 hypothetical protein SQ11_05735 [Nitrosospira sp. NpAV]
MTDKEKILAALKGCNVQSPMSFTELIEKTGIPAMSLIVILQDLFDARAINRATVMRDGLTRVMVWPTGVLPKIPFRQFTINPKKSILPDSDQSQKRITPTPKIEEKIMSTEKSKARIILEIIAKQGTATFKQLTDASGASSVSPFIKGYIGRGEIIVEGLPGAKSCRMAPGVTAESLLSEERKKSTTGLLSGEFKKSITETAPASSAPAQAEHVVDTTGMIQPWKPVQPEARTSADVPARPRFRLARTSDQTLMLFGLNAEPIELDLEQTQLLVSFVKNEDRPCA